MQRRHQKVIEETPSAIVDASMRAAMGAVAVRGALAVGYVGAGTFEFLVDGNTRDFFFLEMNTRLQVEHPVTELCCGVDLVRWQIDIANGEPLPWTQADVLKNVRGHAVEARLYAEDPAKNFLPSPGFIQELKLSDGPGVRNDCGFESGAEVPRFYDPMIAKLAVWAETREAAIAKLSRALGETMVKGITTNVGYLKKILALEEFQAGDYDTGLLARAADRLIPKAPAPDAPLTEEQTIALAAAAIWQLEQDQKSALRGADAKSGNEPASRWAQAARMQGVRRLT